MSVTFTLARYVEDPQFGTVLMCGADHTHTCTANGPCEDNAVYGSCDHADAAEQACGCTALDVQVSNTNAQMILERLGYPADPEDGLAGDADPADLLGRALTGNIGRDDDGIPTVTDDTPGRARHIYCGLRPGYFTGQLDAIARLAAEAQARGELVAWT